MKFRLDTLKIIIAAIALALSGCYTEDPGPIQEYEKEFNEVDFDRLEMGDAFNITVEQSDLFEVEASGDRRNIDDLIVEKEGSSLIIRYDENRNRRHTTDIKIKMPSVKSITFSGASNSRIYGFTADDFLINLSGASVCQLDADIKNVEAVLSGASNLYMTGEGERLDADLSGASVLKAFHFPVDNAQIRVSGASDANVSVSTELDAVATGASVVIYRGNPLVNAEVSGASTVRQD